MLMDLAARKYHFIEELLKIENETIMAKLEKVLSSEVTNISIPSFHKKILKERIDDFKSNPEELLDWEDVKDKW